MSDTNLPILNRIKSLLVASCDSYHQGNRDIAMNMMEIAMDELQNVSPQDVEDGIKVVSVVDNPVDNTVSIEKAMFDDDLNIGNLEIATDDSYLDDNTASTTFRNMINDMMSMVNSNTVNN